MLLMVLKHQIFSWHVSPRTDTEIGTTKTGASSHLTSFAVCPSTTPCQDTAIVQVQILQMKASQECPEGAAGPHFMCSNTDLNKTKLPGTLEGCKAHKEFCCLSSKASHYKVFANKGDINCFCMCFKGRLLPTNSLWMRHLLGTWLFSWGKTKQKRWPCTSVQSFPACSALQSDRTQPLIQS